MSVPSTPGDAEAIKALAELGQKAAGEYKVEWLTPPPGSSGLPEKVPVLIKTGAQPAIEPTNRFFDGWRDRPARISGTAETTNLASFIDLVGLHKGATSALFAKTVWPEPSLTAVIDYHTPGAPDNCGHRIRYAFPLTDDFSLWVKNNGKPMDQLQFAAFMEDNIANLSVAMDNEVEQYEPIFRTKFALPTEMIDLSRGLQVNVGEKVVNAFMNQSGEADIRFSTEHTDAKGEALHVPGLFMLCMPIFIDGGVVRIPARLRYRVKEGMIAWSYQLYRWEFWLRERVQSDFAIATKQTGLPAYEGSPEK